MEANLGLVGMQVNACLRKVGRENHKGTLWDDLFQEGVLGLIHAIRTHPGKSEVTFTNFAVRRIRYAIRRAVVNQEQLIRLPDRAGQLHGSPPDAPASPSSPANPPQHVQAKRRTRPAGPPEVVNSHKSAPKAVPLTSQMLQELRADSSAYDPACTAEDSCGEPDIPTVGVVLAEKVRAAAALAVEKLAGRSARRCDWRRVAQTVLEDRMLIPEEDYRASMRHIAKVTNSSYGRVVKCERQLSAGLRAILCADEEFQRLWDLAASSRHGLDTPLDRKTRRGVYTAVGKKLATRFSQLVPQQQADLLMRLLDGSDSAACDFISRQVRTLSVHERTRLLAELSEEQAA